MPLLAASSNDPDATAVTTAPRAVAEAAVRTRPAARRKTKQSPLRPLVPEQLSDRDLLRLVLQVVRGKTYAESDDDAMQLLYVAGGLGGLRQYINVVRGGTGVSEGNHTALDPRQLDSLSALLELGRRVCRLPILGRELTSHHDIQDWAQGRLTDLEYEEVWVLAVNTSNHVVTEWCVARGGLHGCGLLPSDILRPVLRAAAPAFVLVHNHPSGDPTPSREDITMTRSLQQACKAVGVILLDHVIVSRNGAQSLATLGSF